jgi:hypothetical protein
MYSIIKLVLYEVIFDYILLILALSKLVVGSSKAIIPQLIPKASARDNRITKQANTFYPILQRPFISILAPL